MTGRNVASQMIGQDVAMPVGLAPVGLTGMQHADGEIKAARAAEKFGVPFTLSTMSICSIEDVAEHTEKPFWMQVYTLKDDDFMQRLFDRARDAKCSAAMITVDLQLLGQRHKDLKNGLSAPPKLTPASVANMMTKVPLGPGHAGHQAAQLRQYRGPCQGRDRPLLAEHMDAEAFDQALDWDRIRVFRKMWDGPLIIKGIMDPRDAARGAERGGGRDHRVQPRRAAA